jgi:SulP family sulfate permease
MFAGAKTLEARLPDPTGTVSPAVVLRLRGRSSLSSTAIEVLSRYAQSVANVGGRMYLSGVDPEMVVRLHRTGAIEALGPVEVVTATNMLGAASRDAYERAREWVTEQALPTDEEDG